MIEYWQSICISLGDALFGWALTLPRDLAIVVLGVILGLVLLLVRYATTDRCRLRQIANDERQLRQLIRASRISGDGERLSRYRRTRSLVAIRRVHEEWVAWSISVIILTAFMPWGSRRLEYLPIRPNESIRFVARFPASVVGEVVHVVPFKQTTIRDGWIRIVEAETQSGSIRGQAEWVFNFGAVQERQIVTMRLRNQSLSHPLLVGSPRYELPGRFHDGGVQTEVQLAPYHPLGLLPAHLWLGLPGWSLFLTIVTGGVFLGGIQLSSRFTNSPACMVKSAAVVASVMVSLTNWM